VRTVAGSAVLPVPVVAPQGIPEPLPDVAIVRAKAAELDLVVSGVDQIPSVPVSSKG